ncbi:MAG: hypothetical protein LBI02_08995 [Opitutaceae bacterium]|nr:hypothetical protein [Opitutaceae bacterium]
MHSDTPRANTLPSQTELLRLVDQMALARASGLARAGRFREARYILFEDPTLLRRSPGACDLTARIAFRLGYDKAARAWWKKADRLSNGAEPYRSALVCFQDYAGWRKRRRRALARKLAWRGARRILRSLAARITGGLAPLLKRKPTRPLCRPTKTPPTAPPPREPAPERTPDAARNPPPPATPPPPAPPPPATPPPAPATPPPPAPDSPPPPAPAPRPPST